jgi:Glycosyltransferase like family
MIAFGCVISEPEPYVRHAEPGIRLAAEPDSEVLAFGAVGPIGRGSNLVLEAAAARDGLEALVLVEPETRITDPALCAKLRAAFRDPDVAVVGCAGAQGVRSMAWWEGSIVAGSVTHCYTELGGGCIDAFSWARPERPPAPVDAVDGMLLALSPWAVRNIRFDEALTLGHGYDVDFCFEVRRQQRRVVVEDLSIVHHRPLKLIRQREAWVEAHIQFAQKWDGQMPGAPADDRPAKDRARRNEAEREAAHAIGRGHGLASEAQILVHERAIEQITETRSWRVTEPLRRLNRLRRPEEPDAR